MIRHWGFAREWIGPYRGRFWFGQEDWSLSRCLCYEIAFGFAFGLQVICGGEDRELTFRIGLLFCTLYLSIERVFSLNSDALQRAMKDQGIRYSYQLDYTDSGRTTGVMIGTMGIEFCLWEDGDTHTSRPLRQKFSNWPYCEGAGCWFWWRQLVEWKCIEQKNKVYADDYTMYFKYTTKAGREQVALCKMRKETRTYRLWGVFTKVHKCIWVEFNREMGDGAADAENDWKGGTIGAGMNMRKGESALQCFDRMQIDYQF